MRVRPAIIDDHPFLLDLWERSVRATHDFLSEEDITGLRPHVARALSSDAVGWWVLTSSADAPIGFLGVGRDSIEALFVDPAHHRQGAGQTLVGHAQELCGGDLSVDVNEANGQALAFYEALGFAVVGRSPTDSDGRPFPLLHMKRRAPRPI